MTDWEGVHTCHDECPCHTGGKPAPDFLPVERAIPFLGWYGYLEHLAEIAEARRVAPPSSQVSSGTEPNKET